MKWIPFISKISVKDVAKSMFIVDLKFNSKNNNNQKQEDVYEFIENDEMIRMSKEN